MARFNHLSGKFDTVVNYDDYSTKLLYDGKEIYESCEVFIRIQNNDYAFIMDNGKDTIVTKDGKVYHDDTMDIQDAIIEDHIDGIKDSDYSNMYAKALKEAREFHRILDILRA